MRRNKPWFGPSPYVNLMTGFRSPIWPRSWQGIAVTLALVAGFVMLKLEPHRTQGAIAFALIVVAYGVIVYLTWGRDED